MSVEGLAPAVRKSMHKDDGRLLIDDSKKVNEGPAGLERLEAGVLSAIAVRSQPPVANQNALTEWPATVRDYLAAVTLGDSFDDLHAESWFHPTDALPAVHPAQDLTATIARLSRASNSATVAWGPVHSVVIPAPRFNRLLDEWRVKSGVVASAVIALLARTIDLPGDDAILVNVDKLGGRHFYAPLLNEAFPGCWVRVIREGPSRCDYEIDGLARPVSVRFEPRADGKYLNVALASMAAKYLRELCMVQFNRYWTGRIPGLKPTLGYPEDAKRFYREIRNALIADGIEEKSIWRSK